MTRVGYKRTTIARIGTGAGFVCGVLGVLGSLTNHAWKLGPVGWFEGGILLAVIAIFVQLDGAFASQKESGKPA
jgi:hypothetical protein